MEVEYRGSGFRLSVFRRQRSVGLGKSKSETLHSASDLEKLDGNTRVPEWLGLSVFEPGVALGRLHDALRIAGWTHIAGTGIERGGPHLFVGYAMGAHDRHPGEFAVQPRYLGEARCFDVDHGDFSAVTGDRSAQLGG